MTVKPVPGNLECGYGNK